MRSCHRIGKNLLHLDDSISSDLAANMHSKIIIRDYMGVAHYASFIITWCDYHNLCHSHVVGRCANIDL